MDEISDDTGTPLWAPGAATGVGSMPGEDALEACRTVFGELPGLPHLPELPARGPAAGMIGRACSLLVELHVDLQPSGWRLTSGAGLEERRAATTLAGDLDLLDQVAPDYAGPLKVQVTGPWTLAAQVDRPRGDRILADHGARRDLAASLAEGIGEHVAGVRRRLPGARVLVQLDEPTLPAVLAGRVPTASGFSRHRAVDVPEVAASLTTVVEACRRSGAFPLLHCCAEGTPIELASRVGVGGLSIDPRRIRDTDLDPLAAAVESGVAVFLGAVPTEEPAASGGRPYGDAEVTRSIRTFWRRLGFAADDAGARVVVTPACGLAGASPRWARRALELARRAAANLVDADGPVGGPV